MQMYNLSFFTWRVDKGCIYPSCKTNIFFYIKLRVFFYIKGNENLKIYTKCKNSDINGYLYIKQNVKGCDISIGLLSWVF